jgi:type IV pilus assembly protein PilA
MKLITFMKFARLNSTKLSNKNDQNGFTLIELLVVIIIIGLLSAIALPSFLNQTNKARTAEAKTYIGNLTRLQQTYYMEKQAFSSNIVALGDGAVASSNYYDYSLIAGDVTGNTATPQPKRIITNLANPKSGYVTLQAFVSVVAIADLSASFSSVVCNADQTGSVTLANSGSIAANVVFCPTNFSESF